MRKPILTKLKDLKKIAKEMGKIKNVQAVYLFGSALKKQIHPLSDIDICIVGNLSEKEKRGVLSYASDNLDITFFNDLPLMIQFRVFKEGEPLLMNDQQYIHLLMQKTLAEYLDFRSSINHYCQEVIGCTI